MEISAMENSAEQVEYLYGIIHSYTVFFLIFDVVFFVGVVLVVLLLIKFIKSKKKLIASGGYLRYTITGQEEERGAGHHRPVPCPAHCNRRRGRAGVLPDHRSVHPGSHLRR